MKASRLAELMNELPPEEDVFIQDEWGEEDFILEKLYDHVLLKSNRYDMDAELDDTSFDSTDETIEEDKEIPEDDDEFLYITGD